jgi:hypothetical protein
MLKNKLKSQLEQLTQDALTKNEVMIETLVELLIDRELIDESEFDFAYERNMEKTREKVKRLQEEMEKLLKEMQEKAIDNRLNDPDDTCGNC